MRFPNLTPPLLCGVLACGAPVEQPDTAPPATQVWPAIFAELVDGPFPEVAVPMDDEALVFGVDPQDGGVGWRLSIDGLCARPLDPEVQVLSASSSNANWAGGGLDGRLLLGTEGTDGTVERADLPSLDPVVGVWRGGSETWAVTARVYGQTGNLWRLRTGQDWELMAVDQPGPFHGAWNRWFIGDGVAWYWDGIALVDRAPPIGASLHAAHGAEVTEVWFAGGDTQAELHRWTTSGWEQVEIPAACNHGALRTVFQDDSGTVWFGGQGGTAGHWDRENWQCNLVSEPGTTYTSIVQINERVVWIGGRLDDTGQASGILASDPPRDRITEVSTCTP